MQSVLLLGLYDTAIMTARCLRRSGMDIYGTDYRTELLGFKSNLIKSFICPNPADNEKNWLDFLVKWLTMQDSKTVLIPTSDQFTMLCSKFSPILNVYSVSIIPDEKIIQTIIERDLQFSAAIECGINVPKFISWDNFSIDTVRKEFVYPLAIKPLNTVEWKQKIHNKGFVVNNEIELKEIVNKLIKQEVRFMVQEIIEGENFNNYEVNSLYFPTRELFQHSIQKIRQYPDKFGTATSIKTSVNPDLEELAAKLIKFLNLTGFSNVEFKYNSADKKYYYIETNTRVWLQVNFSAKIGINFPRLYYEYLTNGVFRNEIIKVKEGVWVNILPDILFWVKYRKKYKIGLLVYFKSWFPFRATGLFSLRDPLPFYTELRSKKNNRKRKITP